MIIYCGGVNGSGKSTILKALSAVDHRVQIIHAARFLQEALGLPVGDYEQLRRLPQEQLTGRFGEAFEEFALAHQGDRAIYLFDAHYLNLIRGEIFPKGGPWLAKADGLVLVTAPLDELVARIESDSRDRALFPAGFNQVQRQAMLADYLAQTTTAYQQFVSVTGLPGHTVVNQTGKLEQAVSEVETFINQIISANNREEMQ